MEILEDPFVRAGVVATLLPLAVALIVSGLARAHTPAWAGPALAAGFLVAYVVILGWPLLPPVGVNHKIFYVVLIGALIGLGFDLAPARPGRLRGVALAWPTAIVAWLGWRQLGDPTLGEAARLAALWLAGMFLFDRLLAWRDQGLAAPVILLAAGIGLSLVAFAGSASHSQLGAAVAAVSGAYLLWNWPRRRFAFGVGAVFAAATMLLSVAGANALFTNASPLALALLLLIIAAGFAHRSVTASVPSALGPVLFGAVCAAPALLAIAVAYVLGGGVDENL